MQKQNNRVAFQFQVLNENMQIFIFTIHRLLYSATVLMAVLFCKQMYNQLINHKRPIPYESKRRTTYNVQENLTTPINIFLKAMAL